MSDPGAAVPIPSSTVAMLRDGAAGVEVCMLRRPGASSFAAGAYVFPGGAVDPADADPRLGGDGHRVAGIREVLEETGVLIGAVAPGSGDRAGRIRAARSALLAGGDLATVAHDQGLLVDPGSLAYAGRFITPANQTKRFDTRFFMVRAPDGQEPEFHAAEAVEGGWYPPGSMLDHEFPTLMPPTRVMCHQFAKHATVDAVIATMSADPIEVTSITPELLSRWMALHREQP